MVATGLDLAEDLPAHTRGVRTAARRAWIWAGAWTAVVLVAVTLFVVTSLRAQHLLEDGVAVPDTVVAVHDPRRGTPSITVSYPVGRAAGPAGSTCGFPAAAPSG